MSKQTAVQAQARAISGNSGQWAEDIHAAFDVIGVPAGQLQERINAYTELVGGAAFNSLLENGISLGPLLLDQYPNAAYAYSPRKLRTAYTGPSARVRRTNGGNFNAAHWTGEKYLFGSSVNGIMFTLTPEGEFLKLPGLSVAPTSAFASGLVGATLRTIATHAQTSSNISYSDNNGDSWTTQGVGITVNYNGAARSATNFVICGSSNTLRYSADALTWAAASNSGGTYNAIAANGATVVAVGNTGVIQVSTNNGVSYTASSSSGVTTTQNLNSVTYDSVSGLWIACGNSGTVLTASNPAGTWTLYNNSTSPSVGTTNALNEVRAFGGKVYLAQTNGNIEFTPSGPTFTSRAYGQTFTGLGLASNGTTLVSVGTLGGVVSSTNGTTYTLESNITVDAETDIGFDENGDFDLDTFFSFVGLGNGFARTYYDQSGNGRDVVQATAASQPSLATNGMLFDYGTGKPGLSGSTGKSMQAAGVTLDSPLHLFLAFVNIDPPPFASNAYLVATHGELGTSGIGLYGVSGENFMRFENTDGQVTTYENNILTTDNTFSPGEESTHIISGLRPINTVGAQTMTLFGSTSGASGSGVIFEVIVYPSSKAANREAIYQNQSNYFGF